MKKDDGRRGDDSPGPRRGERQRHVGTRRPALPGERPPRSGGWWRRRSLGAKIAYVAATIVAVLVLVASLGAYAVYRHLDGNIRITAVKGLARRSEYGVQNILILGSQTRDGQGPGFGYDPGTSLSDNLLLVHLDATHAHAIIVSIPRDTLVYEPACKSSSATTRCRPCPTRSSTAR